MELPDNNQDLKTQILNRLQTESLAPNSRWIYSGRELLVWGLWFASAIFGALAVAVSLFALIERHFSLYEVTHENFWSFAIEVLPYLWISIFIIMILLAVYNLRQTKNGYRYPLWQIFTSSLVLSVAGGSLMHLAGVGFFLDNQMGNFSAGYPSQERIEEKIWQSPERGRLVGFVSQSESKPVVLNEVIFFEGLDGRSFETNISQLHLEEINLLRTGKKVRLLGQIISVEPPRFHACAVFPWAFERDYSMKELSELRDTMRKGIERLFVFKDMASSSVISSDLCTQMPVMRRVQVRPR